MKLLNSRVPVALTPTRGLRAIIFDWAGTTVDFGSLAPVRTLQEVFASFGVPLSELQARADMGLPKREHIARIVALPEVAAEWQRRHGNAPDESDIGALYARFVPLQLSCLARYSSPIPGAVQMAERARARGLKIGSTTGYTRQMLDHLLEQSRAFDYLPDCSLSPEDVGAGRPHPYMIFESAKRLRVYPLAALVKVGDTPADIQEGLNAGAWSVGVARTGNMVGLSEADLDALPKEEQERRLSLAHQVLQSAGAHFVIDTVAELDPVLDEIERLLQGNGSPSHARLIQHD